MEKIRLLIASFSILLLCGCGPAFAVNNDTRKRVYVDTIYIDHPRKAAPQALESGNIYSAPRCWNEIARLYLGSDRESLMKRSISKLCEPTSCNCTVNVSEL
jgi:hypothetical protein